MKIAKFYVPRDFVIYNASHVADVLCYLRAVPVRVEMLFHRDSFEYTAISEHFREVADGEVVPEVTIFGEFEVQYAS